MAEFGSVISGTMQPRDLIPAFAALLEEKIGDDPAYVESRKLVADCAQMRDVDFVSGAAHERVFELIECLEMFAPMYGYFGAHPGDGADWGYWLSEDSLHDAEQDGELVRVDDLAHIPPLHERYALVVNDHGNCTLYRVDEVEPVEIWSIV